MFPSFAFGPWLRERSIIQAVLGQSAGKGWGLFCISDSVLVSRGTCQYIDRVVTLAALTHAVFDSALSEAIWKLAISVYGYILHLSCRHAGENCLQATTTDGMMGRVVSKCRNSCPVRFLSNDASADFVSAMFFFLVIVYHCSSIALVT